MRKFLIAITLLFVAVINTMAQEHLSFKGIPIEGSMTEFCQKLKTKGFTQLGRDDNVTTFTGDFTGRQATVGVGATDDGKSVHSVVVIFDESSEWNTLVNTYDYYKGLYIRKYGEPSACREHNPSRQDSNISLMYELGQGTVTYASAWNVTGGTIELSIEKAGYSDGVVIIARSNSTTYPELSRTVEVIKRTNAKILGVILNRVKPHETRKGKGYYSRYGGYYKTSTND